MTNHQTLKNPPISEAVIDIRLAEALSDFDEISSGLLKELEVSYPKKEEIRSFQVSYRINASDLPVPLDSRVGYRLESQDGKYVLQLKKDGIALSNVGAYDGWDTFIKKFTDLWAKFNKKISMAKISRIAVRYINKFELSKKHEDYYKKWMTVGINTNANLKKSSLGYLIEQDGFEWYHADKL